MFNHELTLINVVYVSDNIGNQNKVESKRVVLCNVNTIGRREFYEASTSDLNPEIIFTVNKYEYQKERYAEYEGVKYRIIRDYLLKNEFELVELTCERA